MCRVSSCMPCNRQLLYSLLMHLSFFIKTKCAMTCRDTTGDLNFCSVCAVQWLCSVATPVITHARNTPRPKQMAAIFANGICKCVSLKENLSAFWFEFLWNLYWTFWNSVEREQKWIKPMSWPTKFKFTPIKGLCSNAHKLLPSN